AGQPAPPLARRPPPQNQQPPRAEAPPPQIPTSVFETSPLIAYSRGVQRQVQAMEAGPPPSTKGPKPAPAPKPEVPQIDKIKSPGDIPPSGFNPNFAGMT